ncbi:MAG TPA: hypothetical protein VIK72_13190 [Clostridiaceae bacterium]
MKKIKKSLVLAIIFILATSLVACKVKKTSSDVVARESAVSKDTSVVENNTSEEKADFTYSIINETYAEKGISIEFPQLNKASNPTKADLVNKVIQENIRTELESLRMESEDMGTYSLDLKYELGGGTITRYSAFPIKEPLILKKLLTQLIYIIPKTLH